ncbi:MAG: DUF1573 domain-containing protein [Candidatus Hydrogenedentales bacterium]|jgi:hypothetical protein
MLLAGSLTLFAVLGTIEISPEAVDMGEVWQGELVTRVFAVKNTGPASLELAPPRSGCVCADVRLDTRSIPLGKTANLTVTVGRTRPGTFDTYVAVFDQNAPARFARARLKVTVKDTYHIFGHWTSGEKKEVVHTTLNHLPDCSSGPLNLSVFVQGRRPDDPFLKKGKDAKVSAQLFEVEISEWKADSRRSVPNALRAVLHLRSKSVLSPGLHFDTLLLDLGKHAVFKIPISFRVLGDVNVERDEISLGTIRDRERKEAFVSLDFAEGKSSWKDVRVVRVEPERLAEAVSLDEAQPIGERGVQIPISVNIDRVAQAQASAGSDGFFYVRLWLAPSGDAELGEAVQVTLYGMVLSRKSGGRSPCGGSQ